MENTNRLQSKMGGPKKVTSLVISGEMTSKVEGLGDVPYAMLHPATLYVQHGHVHGLALTCEGQNVHVSVPLDVFDLIQIQEHSLVQ